MIDWVEVQSIATAVLVLTSAGAIAYAALQLRHEREYRAVANLEKQLGFFLSDGFVNARRRLAETRLDEAGLKPWELDDPPVSAFEVLDFYEHLALLVKKGHLDVYDVWHTFYEWAQPVYVDLQPLIESEDSSYSDHYTDLRKLMRQMDEIQLKRMHKNNANHWALWTPDRILEHYRYELSAGGRPRRTRRREETRQAALLDDLQAVEADLRAQVGQAGMEQSGMEQVGVGEAQTASGTTSGMASRTTSGRASGTAERERGHA